MRRDVLFPLLALSIGVSIGIIVDACVVRSIVERNIRATNVDRAEFVLPDPKSVVDRRPRLVVTEPEFDFGEADRGSIVDHNFLQDWIKCKKSQQESDIAFRACMNAACDAATPANPACPPQQWLDTSVFPFVLRGHMQGSRPALL